VIAARHRTPGWLLLLALGALAPPASSARAEGSLDARVREAVVAFLRERAGDPAAEVRVPEPSHLAAVELPAGVEPEGVEVRLGVNPSQPIAGAVPVRVELYAGGQQLLYSHVRAEVLRPVAVAVAATALRRGTILGPDDVGPGTVDRSELPADAVRDPREALGLRVLRRLRPGEVLRHRHLERPPVVERGQLVRMQLVRGALRIQAAGRARDAGAPGDAIRVQNLDSRKEVVGIVRPDGGVDVRF